MKKHVLVCSVYTHRVQDIRILEFLKLIFKSYMLILNNEDKCSSEFANRKETFLDQNVLPNSIKGIDPDSCLNHILP